MDKICNKCKIPKNLTEFNKNKTKKDGYHVWCKKCISDNNKELYVKSKAKIKNNANIYYHNNKSTILPKAKEYRNKSEVKDKQSKYMSKWIVENKIHFKQYQKEYKKQYYRNNPHILICLNIKRRCLNGINDDRVNYKSIDLKTHIESLFESWMTWSNIGKWEVHHNVPISWFKPLTPPNIINDLKNLYPISREENRSIKNKYIKFKIDSNYIKTIIPWIQKDHLPALQIYL